MLRTSLLISLLVACGPSKEERAANEERRKAAAANEKTPADEWKPYAEALAKIKANLDACDATLRASATLAPTDGACSIPADAKFEYAPIRSRQTLADLAEKSKVFCDALLKDVELLDRQSKFAAEKNDIGPMMANQEKIERLGKLYLVGMVYEKSVDPALKDAAAFGVDADAYTPGSIKGTAYLYGVASGKIECAAKVEAKSSAKIEFEKMDATDVEFQAQSAIAADFKGQIEAAIAAAPKVAVGPAK